jgi:hypothetical protein
MMLFRLPSTAALLLLIMFSRHGVAQEVVVEDGWRQQRDEVAMILVRTREMTLHPQLEPKPALSVRFLPDPFDVLPGNAAVFYLKATGFLEQDNARERLRKFHHDELAAAQARGDDAAPPNTWLTMPPDTLPLPEVKEYLALYAFQSPSLREAANRSRFDMERNFRDLDNPIAYLLPEIQVLRQVARTQSLRCRVAIAEGRIDDAIELIGQQFALASHLGQDDFLVSNLVGIAISSIAWNDALYLVQHPQAPNLYWALAAMPTPLVNIDHAMVMERQFLYQQLKVLREVDETPRPAGYWQAFIDRLAGEMGAFAPELSLPSFDDDPAAARAALVGYVVAAYPGAKEYLIDVQKMPREQVEAYPTAQVVFLAVTRFHNHWRDEVFKWNHVPFRELHSRSATANFEQAMSAEANQYGWLAAPTQVLLPAVFAVRAAEARYVQQIALLQTVEAIRMYAAKNDGELPRSLEQLTLPAPDDPFTGEPIKYERRGDSAVLDAHALRGIRFRLVVRIAK